MIDEQRVTDSASTPDQQALSPRAGVALLTLQLRSTLQEASAAEAEVASLDVDAAVWQLRSRLGPLIEDRRQALAAELAAEERRAVEAVETAHVDAARIVSDARAQVEADAARRRTMEAAAAARAATAAATTAAVHAEQPPVLPPVDASAAPSVLDDPLLDWQPKVVPVAAALPPPAVELAPSAPLVPEIIETPGTDVPLIDSHDIWAPAPVDEIVRDREVSWVDVPPVAPSPPVPPSTIVMPATALEPLPSADGHTQPLRVVIDAETFAAAFAAAMAPVLEVLNQGSTQGQYPPPGWVPMQAPPAKKSFWAHAWHPDVLLSGLAMVIVIVVLIAWTG